MRAPEQRHGKPRVIVVVGGRGGRYIFFTHICWRTQNLDGPIRWQARAALGPPRLRRGSTDKVTLEELAGGIGSMTALLVCLK